MSERQGWPSGGRITRRDVLKRGLVGAAGLTLLPAVLAACQSSTPPPSPTQLDFLRRKLSGSLSVGSTHSDDSDKKGMEAIHAAFTAATGLTPTLYTIDHGTFADPWNTYFNGAVPGTPNDVFTWYSGFRMRYFAETGTGSAIDDVWAQVGSNFTAGFANSVVGNDGKVYGIPIDYYPWCMFYRRSVWAAKGYTVPTTWAELLALCAQMQKDGLTPIAFGDKDGWPAMGTFDILNLRLNGYAFHIDLLSGKEKWADSKVTAVFEAWRKLMPFCTPDSSGVTWQQACDALVGKTAGMYFIGLFMTGEVAFVDKTAVDDIDFFPFPFFGNGFDDEKALDAPVDILMLCAKSPTLAADLDNARAYLEFWSKGSTQLLMYQANNGFIPTASDVDTSKLDVLTRKAVSIVSQARRITQFMDRDTRPDFVGANGMQSLLLSFVQDPAQDLRALQKSIADFWDGLPPYTG